MNKFSFDQYAVDLQEVSEHHYLCTILDRSNPEALVPVLAVHGWGHSATDAQLDAWQTAKQFLESETLRISSITEQTYTPMAYIDERQ